MKTFPTTKIGWLRAGSLIVIPLVWFYLLPFISYVQYLPQEGDVIFQSLPKLTRLVRAIEGISGSPLSHCGVVIRKEGKWYVTEEFGDVHDTPLFGFIQRGRWGMFCVYRLRRGYDDAIPGFLEALKIYKGRMYDYRFRLDDDFLYCSEFVYKAYLKATGRELGRLEALGSMNWQPYAETISFYEKGPPPLDRLMITPKNLSQAKQLELVFSYGY